MQHALLYIQKQWVHSISLLLKMVARVLHLFLATAFILVSGAAGTRILLESLKHEGSWDQYSPYRTESELARDPEVSPFLPGGRNGQRYSYFPDCPYAAQPTLILDITAALRSSHPELEYACVYNPSLILLPDQRHFLVTYRAYYDKFPFAPCPRPEDEPLEPLRDNPGHPWSTWWSGGHGWGFAVIDLQLSKDGTAVEGPVVTKSNSIIWSQCK